MNKMLAVLKINKEKGKNGTEIREVNIPEPEEGEALVKVKATSICGTDRHIYNSDKSLINNMNFPLIYGHEFCGNIVSFGKNTKNKFFREGDYVSCEMHRVCGFCYQCRTGRSHICEDTKILGIHENGCFAEYVKVPVNNLIKLNDKIKPEIGSFLDALGNAIHTIQPVKVSGKNVLILGYGPIGAMAASICEFLRSKKIIITEINENGIKMAKEWIKNKNLKEKIEVINVKDKENSEVAKEILKICPEGVDTVLEISGAESAINLSFEVIKKGGEISLLGIPAKENITLKDYTKNIIFKGLTIYSIIGRKMFETWFLMLDLLESGLDLSHIPNKIYNGLENFYEAMEDFNEHRALKAVLFLK